MKLPLFGLKPDPTIDPLADVSPIVARSRQTLLYVIAAGVVIVGAIASMTYRQNLNNAKKNEAAKQAAIIKTNKITPASKVVNEETVTPDQKTVSTPAPSTAKVKPTAITPVVTPTTAPTPAPVAPFVNTTNCLPEHPSTYATYYIAMTNTTYLQTNSYSPTTKMYAALQFAGLLGAANGKQVVVFSPNDYIFDNKLTAAQLAWMNATPENMRSVLGWHIVTGCITYDGINPIKGKTGTMTLTTLNGPVTLTMGGTGVVENAPVAIWDWFTSNGSVSFITDFIKPPIVP